MKEIKFFDPNKAKQVTETTRKTLTKMVAENPALAEKFPYDIAKRFDENWNVWHMVHLPEDNGETDLQWYVAAVFSSKLEAEHFVASKR